MSCLYPSSSGTPVDTMKSNNAQHPITNQSGISPGYIEQNSDKTYLSNLSDTFLAVEEEEMQEASTGSW